MGKIIGSCSHEIDILLPCNQIAVKEFDKNGERCIKTMVVCQNCLVWYTRNNLICHNEEQKRKNG
jgi:hypothetical protein